MTLPSPTKKITVVLFHVTTDLSWPVKAETWGITESVSTMVKMVGMINLGQAGANRQWEGKKNKIREKKSSARKLLSPSF